MITMSDSNVIALLQPDQAAMTQHLEHLFDGFLDGCHGGVIELAWTDANDGKLRHAEMFGTDDLDRIAERAAELNAVPGQNVYIGAALRKAGTFPTARGDDDDYFATPAFYVDLDDEGAADAVTGKYRGCKPTLAVVTGRQPYKRVQLWWRLETPERDAELHRAQCLALAVELGGDRVVVNPSRVMRLGGSIAWPRKPGRVRERTEVIAFSDGRPLIMMPGQLAKAYPPLVPMPLMAVPTAVAGMAVPAPAGTHQAATAPQVASTVTSPITGRLRPSALIQAIQAGDQWHNNMIRLIAHWVGRGLSDAEILNQAAGLTLSGWTREQTAQEMAQAIRGARAKWAKPSVEVEFDAETGEVVQPGELRRLVRILNLSEIDLLAPPTYAVDDLITETGFTLVYGAPAAFKSFLAIDWMLSMSYGEPWCSREVLPKTVLYIAGEGVGGIKKRVKAWRIEHGKLDTESPFYMLEHGINFTRPEHIQELLRVAQQFSDETGLQFEMVCVDTVARAMVGAEEKDSTAMGIFVEACDTVRRHFKCGLIAVHHTGKDKSLGSRGSNALPAAVDTEIFIDRQEHEMNMKMEVKKQKDDEEGLPMHFDAIKISLPSPGVKPISSLILRPTQAPVEEKKILSKPQVNELLREAARAWNDGRPWSNAVQVKKDGRWFPLWISQQFSIDLEESKSTLEWLLFNKFLVIDTVSRKSKMVGLKVLKYHPGAAEVAEVGGLSD